MKICNLLDIDMNYHNFKMLSCLTPSQLTLTPNNSLLLPGSIYYPSCNDANYFLLRPRGTINNVVTILDMETCKARAASLSDMKSRFIPRKNDFYVATSSESKRYEFSGNTIELKESYDYAIENVLENGTQLMWNKEPLTIIENGVKCDLPACIQGYETVYG